MPDETFVDSSGPPVTSESVGAPAPESAPETTPSEPTEVSPAAETPEISPAEVPVEPEQEPEPVAAAPPKPQTPEQIEQEKTLSEAYRKFPEIKEFLKANPRVKPFWHLGAQLQREYKTLADAQYAKTQAGELDNFDRLYYDEKPESTEQFLDGLWKNSLKDPAKPFDPSANPSSGAYERVAKSVVGRAFNAIADMIDRNPNYASRAGLQWTNEQSRMVLEEMALKLFNIQLKGGAGVDGQAPAVPGTTQTRAADPREAELNRRQAELDARERGIKETTEKEFTNSIQTSFNNYLSKEVDRVTKPAAAVLAKQPQGVQKYVRSEISNRVKDAIQNDDLFNRQFDQASRGGDRSPEHVAQLRQMLEQRTQLYFADIASTVLSEIGYRVVAQQQANDERREAAAARREPTAGAASAGRLSGGPPRTPFKPTGNRDADWRRIMGLE